jgi:hypothetical protein
MISESLSSLYIPTLPDDRDQIKMNIPRAWANEIYNVLVEECDAQEHDRESFCLNVAEDCTEYRFEGNLGFGGKFWDYGVWHVDCYPEDLTPQAAAIIERANDRLESLYEQSPVELRD